MVPGDYVLKRKKKANEVGRDDSGVLVYPPAAMRLQKEMGREHYNKKKEEAREYHRQCRRDAKRGYKKSGIPLPQACILENSGNPPTTKESESHSDKKKRDVQNVKKELKVRSDSKKDQARAFHQQCQIDKANKDFQSKSCYKPEIIKINLAGKVTHWDYASSFGFIKIDDFRNKVLEMKAESKGEMKTGDSVEPEGEANNETNEEGGSKCEPKRNESTRLDFVCRSDTFFVQSSQIMSGLEEMNSGVDFFISTIELNPNPAKQHAVRMGFVGKQKSDRSTIQKQYKHLKANEFLQPLHQKSVQARILLRNLRWSHDAISSCFKANRSKHDVGKLAAYLDSGHSVEEVLSHNPLQVVFHKYAYYSLSNRRLHALKSATSLQSPDQSVPVMLFRCPEDFGIKNFDKKMSSVSNGESVLIRGHRFDRYKFVEKISDLYLKKALVTNETRTENLIAVPGVRIEYEIIEWLYDAKTEQFEGKELTFEDVDRMVSKQESFDEDLKKALKLDITLTVLASDKDEMDAALDVFDKYRAPVAGTKANKKAAKKDTKQPLSVFPGPKKHTENQALKKLTKKEVNVGVMSTILSPNPKQEAGKKGAMGAGEKGATGADENAVQQVQKKVVKKAKKKEPTTAAAIDERVRHAATKKQETHDELHRQEVSNK